LLITKFVFTAAIALGAATAIAAPAGADPSLFGALSCNCTQPSDIPHGKPAVSDQLRQGIQSGLGSLHHDPPSPDSF
jgi:hypothetical protein